MAAPDNKTRNQKRRNKPSSPEHKEPGKSVRPRCGAGKTQGEDDVFCLSQRVANEQRHRRRNKEARVARRAVQDGAAALYRCAFCHAGLDLLVALFPRAHGCRRCRRRRRRVYLRSRGRGFLPRKSSEGGASAECGTFRSNNRAQLRRRATQSAGTRPPVDALSAPGRRASRSG